MPRGIYKRKKKVAEPRKVRPKQSGINIQIEVADVPNFVDALDHCERVLAFKLIRQLVDLLSQRYEEEIVLE